MAKSKSSRFVHDEDCAVIRDAAETADWDDPHYMPPACTCRERQKARTRLQSQAASLGGDQRGSAWHEGDQLAPGCYVKPISRGHC